MRHEPAQLFSFIASALLAFTSLCARADDTEIFDISAATSPGNPNILFILDTSGSMKDHVYKLADYDPSITYDTTHAYACNPTKIYYEKGTAVPTCGSKQTAPSPSFDSSLLKCDAANTSIASSGFYGGTGNNTNAIRWTHATSAISTTVTPSISTRKRTNTSTYDNTVVATTPMKVTVTVTIKKGKPTYNYNSGPTPTGSTTVSTNNSTPVVSVGAWGAATVSPSGSPVTSNSSTDTYSWSAELTAPTNTSSTTSSTSATGTGSSTTDSGAYAPNTPNPITIDSPALPTTAGTYTYNFTRTITTTTTYTRQDTETESTPVSVSSTTAAVTYTVSDVECDGDKTIGSGTSLNYPNNVNPSSGSEWTTAKANSYWDTGGGLQQYQMYSGNYKNYLYNPPVATDEGTKLSVMQKAITDLIGSMNNDNVGLMRYSNNADDTSGSTEYKAQGGMVTYAVTPLNATSKKEIVDIVNGYKADGYTPLSETLYEAYRYYSGGDVLYGLNSKDTCTSSWSGTVCHSAPSVDASLLSTDKTKYKSPIETTCANNFVIYLTDGLPTEDTQADADIKKLDSSLRGSCIGTTTTDGDCLGALAQYMYRADLNPNLTGIQGVASYFIGFGSDFKANGNTTAAFDYLKTAGTRGGGDAYAASDSIELTKYLVQAVGDVEARNTSFAAPSVAVNAFNRTTTLNDLYISVFQPSSTMHWPGNVKKYHIANGQIVDQNGDPAVNSATGFFLHDSLSFWTGGDPDGANSALVVGSPDGDYVPAGGAAHKIPSPSLRKVYTYIGSDTHPSTAVDLTSSNYAVKTSNSNLKNQTTGVSALLGTSTSAETDALINWARGQDVDDTVSPAKPAGDNPNNDQTDARNVMGDPIHARPAVVIYGGTADDPDTVVFAPTNDGYLHAIGGKDNDGVELWSFIPQELLPRLKSLHANGTVSTKQYALDGDVTVLKYDVNGNGVIDTGDGDRVILVFGQGRGGSHYYALDVTDRNAPKFLWSIGSTHPDGSSDANFLNIQQAWSTPILTKVKVSGATQNSQKLVLIFGGGYDSTEETTGYHAMDSYGHSIFMVDALYGTKLWSANSSGGDLNLTRMDHAIPGNINVLDLDGDGYADRMYAGDLAGQLWRFDIYNGQAASSLVTGGVIASLGVHDATSHTSDTDNRRFFSAPDAALITPANSAPYMNIAIGSGYRSHPLSTATTDRFYSIRDKRPYAKLTNSDYGTVLQDSDASIVDITTNLTPTLDPATTNGWKLTLSSSEKVLSSSTTFQGYVLFTSYIPNPSTTTTKNDCSQVSFSAGTNRSYSVNVIDGSPVKKANQDYTHSCSTSTCTATDRYDELKQGGIAPGVVILFPSTTSSSSSSSADGSGSSSSSSTSSSSCTSNCGDIDEGRSTLCLSGGEAVNCPPIVGKYKTFWKDSSGAGS